MGAISTPPSTSTSTITTTTTDERYDFEITYEMNTDRSSFFPYKFSYVTYPDVLRNVITQHEYQNVVELLSIQGEPHNFLFRDLILVYFFFLLLPLIITVSTTVYNPILIYSIVGGLVYLIFLLPFLALRIYRSFKKRKAVIAELEKRGVKLNLFFKFRKFNAIFGGTLFIQSLLWMNWCSIKFTYSSAIVAMFSLMETFIYVCIVLDIIIIIYLGYCFMLFTKYRDVITNTTQSEHLTRLTEIIKKIEIVPYYLSYNISKQPLLLSTSEDV